MHSVVSSDSNMKHTVYMWLHTEPSSLRAGSVGTERVESYLIHSVQYVRKHSS